MCTDQQSFHPPRQPTALPTLVQYYCTPIGQYTTPPPNSRAYAIHRTILVITISCKGQSRTPEGGGILLSLTHAMHTYRPARRRLMDVPQYHHTRWGIGRPGPNLTPGTVCVCGMSGLRKGMHTSQHPPSPAFRAGNDPPTNVQAVSRAVRYVNTHRPRSQVGLYTVLPLPILYGVWHTKVGSGACRILRNRRATVWK